MAGDPAVRNRTFEQPEHAMAGSNIWTIDAALVIDPLITVITLSECCCLQTGHPNCTFESASKVADPCNSSASRPQIAAS